MAADPGACAARQALAGVARGAQPWGAACSCPSGPRAAAKAAARRAPAVTAPPGRQARTAPQAASSSPGPPQPRRCAAANHLISAPRPRLRGAPWRRVTAADSWALHLQPARSSFRRRRCAGPGAAGGHNRAVARRPWAGAGRAAPRYAQQLGRGGPGPAPGAPGDVRGAGERHCGAYLGRRHVPGARPGLGARHACSSAGRWRRAAQGRACPPRRAQVPRRTRRRRLALAPPELLLIRAMGSQVRTPRLSPDGLRCARVRCSTGADDLCLQRVSEVPFQLEGSHRQMVPCRTCVQLRAAHPVTNCPACKTVPWRAVSHVCYGLAAHFQW